ncbi:MAG: B-4DMT family transporter [Gordonia sp. (in: high G+C Gram-positive bacteria)]|uniref:B-4DMT family transporter n=1 Tax=Gordonia sp. (in: high G+C Gram-positive bacteria) TaxID=84139 RepID=UPI0039E3535B
MHQWLVRGIVMSIIVIAVRFALGEFVSNFPEESPTYRTLALLIVVLVALIWGGVDGLWDARKNPDPDDYEDLTMRWLKAGLFAGVVSCLVCFILGTYWLKGMGQSSFFIDMTAGTSFITLLIYVPAFIGVSVGRYLIRRDLRKKELAAQDAAERAGDTGALSTSGTTVPVTAGIDGSSATGGASSAAASGSATATALAYRPTETIATTAAAGGAAAGGAAAGRSAKRGLRGARRGKKSATETAAVAATTAAAGSSEASGSVAVPAGAHLPLADPNQVPEGFPIKGNADSGLYHTPESPWYSQTVAEMWFATEEAAQAAGYSHPER